MSPTVLRLVYLWIALHCNWWDTYGIRKENPSIEYLEHSLERPAVIVEELEQKQRSRRNYALLHPLNVFVRSDWLTDVTRVILVHFGQKRIAPFSCTAFPFGTYRIPTDSHAFAQRDQQQSKTEFKQKNTRNPHQRQGQSSLLLEIVVRFRWSNWVSGPIPCPM